MESHVYFLLSRKDGLVKIGWSASVHKRISRSFGPDVELIGIVHGGRQEEQRMHSIFADHRVYSEWFRDNDAIRQFIEENSVSLKELYALFLPYRKASRAKKPLPRPPVANSLHNPALQERIQRSLNHSVAVRASMRLKCACGHCKICSHREYMRESRAERRLARLAAI